MRKAAGDGSVFLAMSQTPAGLHTAKASHLMKLGLARAGNHYQKPLYSVLFGNKGAIVVVIAVAMMLLVMMINASVVTRNVVCASYLVDGLSPSLRVALSAPQNVLQQLLKPTADKIAAVQVCMADSPFPLTTEGPLVSRRLGVASSFSVEVTAGLQLQHLSNYLDASSHPFCFPQNLLICNFTWKKFF